MKANELMIGDWVMINPISYYQVEQIRVEFGELRIYLKGTEVFATENEIMPIPLTPEILEKNGFDGVSVYNWSDDIYLVSLYHWDIGKWEVVIYNLDRDQFIIRLYITYVHQLQHALRLCGINKEIVL